MSYDTYLEKYADRFAILGGVCVQSAIGILSRAELEREIRRVFGWEGNGGSAVPRISCRTIVPWRI